MKIKIIHCTLVFLSLATMFSNSLYSQSRWIDMHSLPQLSTGDRYEDVYFVNAKTGYAVHASGKIYKTTNGGQTFSLKYQSSGVFFRSTGFFDENTGIIGTFTAANPIFRTTNSGANWSPVTNVNGVMPQAICGISIIDSQSAVGVGLYSCPPFFMKTTDKGYSWTSYSLDTHMVKSLVDCYFWSRDSGIVVGGYNPYQNNWGLSNAVILYTSDGGKSFTQVFRSNRTGEWCWKISFVNSNTGFVSVEASNKAIILKTTNKGLNWTEAYVGAAAHDLEGTGFINENTGWMGGWGGYTFKTTNGGQNWTQETWSRLVNRFRFISDTLGYCVGNSFYKFTQESVGISSQSESLPGKFYLHQNYPNPFNPSTKINYEIRFSGNVTLKIYDAKGNEVSDLVNKYHTPGIYAADFNAADFPSGIYFYKMENDEFSETRKMVLIK